MRWTFAWRHIATTAGFAAAVLGPTAASAATTTFMGLQDSEGNVLWDYQLVALFDQFFPGGAGVVSADIIIVGTACYAGSLGENVNPTLGDDPLPPLSRPNIEYGGGAIYDNVSFTNTTFMSANSQGVGSYYTGYHDDISVALAPGFTTGFAHEIGVFGRANNVEYEQVETPLFSGSSDKIIGGTSSTHVLAWFSDPNDLDRQDALNLEINFELHPGAEVSVLIGGDDVDIGVNTRVGPATIAMLTSEFARIGPLITPGEQFIFFIGDHGTNKYMSLSAAPVGAKTTAPGSPSDARAGVGIEVGDFAIEYLFDAAGNKPSIELLTADAISTPRS